MSVLKQIDVHQLDNHVSDIEMDFAQFSIFCDQISRLSLNLFDVIFDFYWIIPGHCVSIFGLLAFRILDDVLKTSQFLKHHWLLTVNHLRAHRVVKVSHLLQCDSLFVKLFCVFGHVINWFWDFEAMLAQNSSVFYKCYQFFAIIDFKKTTFFVAEVELHKLASHLVLALLVWVIQRSFNRVTPLLKKVVLKGFNRLAKILIFLGKPLHTRNITKHGLRGFQIGL
jgi:hypothetical protein